MGASGEDAFMDDVASGTGVPERPSAETTPSPEKGPKDPKPEIPDSVSDSADEFYLGDDSGNADEGDDEEKLCEQYLWRQKIEIPCSALEEFEGSQEIDGDNDDSDTDTLGRPSINDSPTRAAQ